MDAIREACVSRNLSCAPLGRGRYRVWFRTDRAVHIMALPGNRWVYGAHGCKSFIHPYMGIEVPVVMIHDGFYGIECSDLDEALLAAGPDRIDPNHYALGPVARRAYLLHLFETQGGKCYYCGAKIKTKNSTIDHMTPLARGGADKYYNMCMACKPCNRKKDDKTAEEFMGELRNGKHS